MPQEVNTIPKERTYDVLSMQREGGNGTKNTQKKRYLHQINEREKKKEETRLYLLLVIGQTIGPLGAHRITEQPRRHGSSARYIRDPMTQGYRPGGACRSCGTIARKSSRSPGPFLVVSHYTIWTTVITLQIPPVTYTPRASTVQVRCPIAGCAFA